MIEIAENVIRTNYKKFGLPRSPHSISFLKMGGRQDRSAPVSFACFLDGEDHPSFYVKFPRNPFDNGSVKAEFDNLCKIHVKIKNKAIRDSVPLPLWCNKNPVFTIQNALAGVPMMSEINKRNFSRFSEDTLSWLAKFHEETKVGDIRYGKFICGKLGQMKNEIQAYSKEAARLFSRGFTFVAERTKENFKMPITHVHGDFNPHNILIDNKKLRIFDWEDSSVNLSFIDVFHFFTVSSFSVAFNRSDRKLSVGDRYRRHFLKEMVKILSQIQNGYKFSNLNDFFVPSYIFYLTNMAVTEIKRDRLINNFDFWRDLLGMFIAEVA